MDFGSEEELLNYARTTGRAYVSLTLTQGDSVQLGVIVLELFTDVCPRTCDNFISLVKGTGASKFSYKGSPVHRVVKQAYIQAGDVVDGTGKGDPGYQLADEAFAVKHDAPGVLAMATNGEPHTGATQFYITLDALPWLDGKRVAFGKVLTAEGLEVLTKVEGLILNNERPVPEVVISEAHVLHEPDAQ